MKTTLNLFRKGATAIYDNFVEKSSNRVIFFSREKDNYVWRALNAKITWGSLVCIGERMVSPPCLNIGWRLIAQQN